MQLQQILDTVSELAAEYGVHLKPSIGAQYRLLSISQSSFYYAPQAKPEVILALMQLIHRQFLETLFHGERAEVRWKRRRNRQLVSRAFVLFNFMFVICSRRY